MKLEVVSVVLCFDLLRCPGLDKLLRDLLPSTFPILLEPLLKSLDFLFAPRACIFIPFRTSDQLLFELTDHLALVCHFTPSAVTCIQLRIYFLLDEECPRGGILKLAPLVTDLPILCQIGLESSPSVDH